jgi:hypothetical protein
MHVASVKIWKRVFYKENSESGVVTKETEMPMKLPTTVENFDKGSDRKVKLFCKPRGH